MKKVVSVLVLVSIFFTYGCKVPMLQQNPDRPLTDEEAHEKRREAIAQTATVCALVGATIAYVTTKKKEKSLFWGVIGGLGCGLFAHHYTKKLDKERAQLKGREEDLDAQLKYARAVNEETRRYNEISTLEIEDIEHRVDKGKAKKRRLEVVQYRLEEDQENLGKTIADLTKYRDGLVKGHKEKEKVADLDKQIQELQAQLAVLEKNTQKVASLNKRIKV